MPPCILASFCLVSPVCIWFVRSTVTGNWFVQSTIKGGTVSGRRGSTDGSNSNRNTNTNTHIDTTDGSGKKSTCAFVFVFVLQICVFVWSTLKGGTVCFWVALVYRLLWRVVSICTCSWICIFICICICIFICMYLFEVQSKEVLSLGGSVKSSFVWCFVSGQRWSTDGSGVTSAFVWYLYLHMYLRLYL